MSDVRLDMRQATMDFQIAQQAKNGQYVQSGVTYNGSVFSQYDTQQPYVSEVTGNTCTDGSDDGEIGFWEGAKSVCKGVGKFFTNIGKQFVEHPIKSVLVTAVGIGLCCIPVVGPFIGGAMAVAGIVGGGIQVAKGIDAAHKAKTDADKKDALENIGTGTTTAVVSAIALKGAVKQMRTDLGGGSQTVNTLKKMNADGASKGEMFKTAMHEGAAETGSRVKAIGTNAIEKYEKMREGIKEEGVLGYAKGKAVDKWTQFKDSTVYKKGKQMYDDGVDTAARKIDEWDEARTARKSGKPSDAPKTKLTAEQKATNAVKDALGKIDDLGDIQVTMKGDTIKGAEVQIRGETYKVELKHGKPTGTLTREVNGVTETYTYRKGKLASSTSAPTAVDGKVPDGDVVAHKYTKEGDIKSFKGTSTSTENGQTVVTGKEQHTGRLGEKNVTSKTVYETGDKGTKIKLTSESTTTYTAKDGTTSTASVERTYKGGKVSEVTSTGANSGTGTSYYELKEFGPKGVSTAGEYTIGEHTYSDTGIFGRFVRRFAKLDAGRFGTFTNMKIPGVNDNLVYYVNTTQGINQELELD